MNTLAIKELEAQVRRKDKEINRLNGLLNNPDIEYAVETIHGENRTTGINLYANVYVAKQMAELLKPSKDERVRITVVCK